jgi:hypothetical protein
MVVCDKIYNMTEIPQPNQEGQENRPHLEDPQPLGDSIDTVVGSLIESSTIPLYMDQLMLRQKYLYEEHRDKQNQGGRLTPSEEAELDDINNLLLEVNHVYEKYHLAE